MRKLFEWADDFPPGRVPLMLIILALGSGAAILLRGSLAIDPAIDIWTFTHIGSEEYKARLEGHPLESETHIQNLGAAMFDRLALSVMTQTELPDLVEIEQSKVGRYMRGPIEHIPFVDLTERIRAEGWDERVVRARFARYSVGGRIFGVPHDLHPTVLVYRPDVLAELGATPEDLETWETFVPLAQRFYREGAMGTDQWRRGIALSTNEGFDFLMLLWQRGGDAFSPEGEVIINNELAVDTFRFLLSLHFGDPPAAGSKLTGLTEDFAALERGQFLVYPAPDWMLATMRLDMGRQMSGKLRIMPLPAWEKGGRRTTTIGGTAMFIPRGANDVEASWEMLKLLYFDRESLLKRFRSQSIVPPLRDVFDDQAFAEPSQYFQGQAIGTLLTELAGEVPPVQGSPYLADAFTLMNAVTSDTFSLAKQTANEMRDRGASEAEIDQTWREIAQNALDQVASNLTQMMARDRAAIEIYQNTGGQP